MALGGYRLDAMYTDTKPCRVCGADVELRAREPGPLHETRVDAGKDPDGPVDERVCSNPECPTRQTGPDAPSA